MVAASMAGESDGFQSQSAAETQAQTSTPAPQQTTTVQEFAVEAQHGKAALYGIVTDQSGAVIPNGTATVTAPGAPPVTATVNAQGRYVLNGLTAGQYHLKVESQGFAVP